MSDIKWIRKQENDASSARQQMFNRTANKRANELNLEKKDNIIERFEYLERKMDALFQILTNPNSHQYNDYPIGNFKKEMKRQAKQEILEK
jgi:hypothetical protein|tara:strand:- start:22 stop:294 length:273 start_codon:yes stop_codon:yes gene_type:complete